jgi:hypothetical protein
MPADGPADREKMTHCSVNVGLGDVIGIQHGRNTNVTSLGICSMREAPGFTRMSGALTARPAVDESYGHEGLHTRGDDREESQDVSHGTLRGRSV